MKQAIFLKKKLIMNSCWKIQIQFMEMNYNCIHIRYQTENDQYKNHQSVAVSG